MGQISLQIPQVGLSDSTEDVKVANNFTTLQNTINGSLDSNNIANSLAQSASVNTGTQTVKGAVNIATSESRTNTAFGLLTTPDQVTGIVLPVNGLIVVAYQALWQESVAGAAQAAIFLGSNQIQAQGFDNVTHGPLVQSALTGCLNPNLNTPLFTCCAGLAGSGSSTAYGADATTGQLVGYLNYNGPANPCMQIGTHTVPATFQAGQPFGGPCYIFAAAGTYTVSVQFKSSSGSVTASGRKLWAQALSFA